MALANNATAYMLSGLLALFKRHCRMQHHSFKLAVPAIFMLTMAMSLSALSLSVAHGAPHKCVGAGGKVEYTDGPCKVGSTEKPIKAKPVTVLKGEEISGKPKDPAETEKANDHRPKWLKEANQTLDPIAQCKAKGGTIDKEFKACRLP
jgi:hypothetical protein